MNVTKELVTGRLKDIIVPETDNSVDSYVKELQIKEKDIFLDIDLERKSMPIKNSLQKVIKNVLSDLGNGGYKLHLSINEKQFEEPKKIEFNVPLSGVKNIIAVASGKGGVGKSTVSTNLALALSKKGFKVGLLDADVYGPSIPKMLDLEYERPIIQKKGDKDYIVPLEKHGVKIMSIGFFIKESDALIWRGAMATGAIKQLINDVDWGELDYFVIDLPPGTGDVPLTMVQTIPITGAVIVTTPQKVATIDVVKSIEMFKTKKIEVPILGVIENMSWFSPTDNPKKKYYLFGQGGGQAIAYKFGIKLIGQIPIGETIAEDADNGRPIVLQSDTIQSNIFADVANQLVTLIDKRNKEIKPTEVLEIK